MDDKTRLNNSVFNDEISPLFTRENASNIIRFNTFSAIQTNTAIWTPSSGKRIFLTAMETSALSAVVVTLNRAGNAPFLSVILTTTLATYGESFPSPVKFAANEAISLTTSAAIAMNITLFGYEA